VGHRAERGRVRRPRGLHESARRYPRDRGNGLLHPRVHDLAQALDRAAGAIPPLVGWAAITGSLDLAAWLLFAIIFFWTPAHFWALALLIRDDYERAGVPMLPVVRGDEATAWNILAYAASLLPLTLLLFIIGGLGYVYLAAAIILGALFIGYAFRLLRSGTVRRRAMARAVYLYSLLYLALLFVAIMVDSTLRL
jgi:protoheme IX farnesyltransferase